MIELRWYVKEISEPIAGAFVTVEHKILQSRYMANPEEIGLQEPIWSDWVEVPIVYDK